GEKGITTSRFFESFTLFIHEEPGTVECREIQSGPDWQVFENGKLRVAQLRFTDRGSYMCHASNGVGPGLSSVITLNVRVRFNEFYHNQTMQRDHSVGLECRASGDAPITISWSRDGRRLDTHKLCVAFLLLHGQTFCSSRFHFFPAILPMIF
ncbi:hypothetical protein MTO96_027766, partial [Rhipicephalus appendiculatus]